MLSFFKKKPIYVNNKIITEYSLQSTNDYIKKITKQKRDNDEFNVTFDECKKIVSTSSPSSSLPDKFYYIPFFVFSYFIFLYSIRKNKI